MWEQNKHGDAFICVNGWRLKVDCRRDGITLAANRGDRFDASGTISLVGADVPLVTESFVRGDELHLVMPQQDSNDVGLDIVLWVVIADDDHLVLESTLSMQTLWLNAYPAIELGIAGRGALTNYIVGSSRVFSRSQSANSPTVDLPPMCVLIDERDQLSVDDTAEAGGKLRFFGDFMEKGVIRKTQPWWVWSSVASDESRVIRLANELAKRPLPLAS